mmetsp:Transcript_42323/g.128392  ORF Transcript_42323/g.128392 Transcript_42323/m.128392 type:complete len:218 (-) Transcript_42323:55-708(-)
MDVVSCLFWSIAISRSMSATDVKRMELLVSFRCCESFSVLDLASSRRARIALFSSMRAPFFARSFERTSFCAPAAELRLEFIVESILDWILRRCSFRASISVVILAKSTSCSSLLGRGTRGMGLERSKSSSMAVSSLCLRPPFPSPPLLPSFAPFSPEDAVAAAFSSGVFSSGASGALLSSAAGAAVSGWAVVVSSAILAPLFGRLSVVRRPGRVGG